MLDQKRLEVTKYRFSNIQNYRNPDILFIGSSHAFREFDTRIFKAAGYRTFNLGTTGQTPLQSEMFLRKYLNILKPKTVVFETFPYMFQSDNYEGEVNFIAEGLDEIDISNTLRIISTGNIKLINTYFYHSVFATQENVTLSQKSRIFAGYVETDKGKFLAGEKIYQSPMWIPRSSQIRSFENIVKLLKDNKIKLILVQAPVTKDCFNSLNNNKAIDKYFSSKGVYYNFNRILSLKDSTYFYDSNHLNLKGVKVFNNAFIDICLKNNQP